MGTCMNINIIRDGPPNYYKIADTNLDFHMFYGFGNRYPATKIYN
jgi:hypothetical protein